jgi:hypothetical protein
MTLPELFLPSRAGKTLDQSGMDSPDRCMDLAHFKLYPHPVQYVYNSRGFRDAEWPSDLSQVIWCVGDSFTVGMGAPAHHAWPAVLQRRTGRTCINVSKDGASNNWIARTALAILSEFPTADIVVHWSFLHRREIDLNAALQKKFEFFYDSVRDPTWTDCEFAEFAQLPLRIQKELTRIHGWNTDIFSDDRVTHYVDSDYSEDIANTKTCIQQLASRVIHSHIPAWAPPDIDIGIDIDNIIATEQMDLARDGFHYDIGTSELLVDKIMSALASRAIAQAL